MRPDTLTHGERSVTEQEEGQRGDNHVESFEEAVQHGNPGEETLCMFTADNEFVGT